MEAPPTPPLEVAEANFLLEFSVILFDPPAAFGRGDDVLEERMARQGGLSVTCVPKVPIWKALDFNGLRQACSCNLMIS